MRVWEQAWALCRAHLAPTTRMLGAESSQAEQLQAEVCALKAENAALRDQCQTLQAKAQALQAEVQTLQAEVQALLERVAQNSRNSHQPPSRDGLAKPKPKSLRQPSHRPTGGQPGHPGRTLRLVEQPDHTVRHAVGQCAGCGQSLAAQAPDRIERRQVFELPEPQLEVTEHQREVKTCSCGCVNRAAFPPEVTAPVQYGPRIKSVVLYLKEYQLLPFERLAEVMRDLFACGSLSEGTLANISTDCSRRLEPVAAVIRNLAAQSSVAGFDETGLRALGSLHWLHTVSTPVLTWYYAHPRRGRQAMEAAGILPHYSGCAVHDFWDAYLGYDCAHAFCNAHLLRELTFLWEEQGQSWAQQMIELLLASKQTVETVRQAGQSTLTQAQLDRGLERYQQIVEAGYAQNPVEPLPLEPKRRGRRKQSKARNLLDRFRAHSKGILAFMGDFAIPFDNNLSERDLRMMKLRQKISGTFRNFEALEDFCRIRSYIATARKNGLKALEALHRVLLGKPFVPTVPTVPAVDSG